MTARATDLPGLLSDAGIRLKRTMTPGSEHKVVCPKCHGGKTREESLSVRIDEDGRGATWNCKRGSCGYADGGKIARDRETPRDRTPEPERRVVPPPTVDPREQDRGAGLYAFWEKRAISRETVDAFGLYLAKRWFPEHAGLPSGEYPAMVFPYLIDGRLVNRKYRSAKKMFMQEKDALPSLFNIDAVTSLDRVVWVEGEPDVLAMHEAGYPQTVSLPNGAPAANVKNDEKRYLPLDTHAEMLAKVERFILAGDMDAPGLALREELARRLGRHRCWLVTWPEGCKDANDTLLKGGPALVQAAIEAAEPYPIQGVQRLSGDTLLKLRRQPPPAVMTTGCGALNQALAFPTEGRLIVFVGIPSHGKTSVARFVMVHTMEHHDRRWAVFSPEMQPWEQFVASCAEVFHGKQFWPDPTMPLVPAMSDDEIAFAERWFRHRLVMLVSDAEDDPPTIDWIIDRARACVLRDGVTDLLIDPWNEVEHSRGGMTEAEYVGRSLQRLKAFGLRHGCNIWILAHPPNLRPVKPGAPIEAPGIYDISGGANWANKADLAITIHTPAGENTKVLLRKARFRRFGQRGASAEMAFDRATGRYSTPIG